MKANAPDKIYTLPSCHDRWYEEKRDDENVEYTRTDVFIEKAVRRLEHYIDNGVWIASDVGHREKEAIIEDFRKYLEE